MINGRGEVFSAAAVAEVDSDNIEAGAKTLLGSCLHIVGSGGSFDSVPGNNRWTRLRVRLPAAMCQHFDTRCHIKQTLFISFGGETKSAWPGIGSDGLRVAAMK